MAVQQTTSDLLTTTTIRTCPNPVFVIGSPRSGTSVLPWSLAHHGEFWTSGETEFIHAFFDQGFAVYKALCGRKRTFIPSNGVGHEEFFSALGLGINALISSRSEGRRWIDQSPGYTTMAWVLADMFPGARFIHVLRDGRSVVNSMIHFGDRAEDRAARYPLQDWAIDFKVAVETWRHYVEFALNFCARNPDRTLTVKNEDLVERPDDEFGRILAFLGAGQNPQPAKFFRESRVNSSFGPLVWATPGDETQNSSQSVPRAAAADVWRDWSTEQRATFTEVAGDLLLRLGYPDSDRLEAAGT